MNNFIKKNLIIVFSIFFFNSLNANTILDISEEDYVIGSKDAPITIIEYASLSCSHCANFHINVLKELKKDYIDSGKVRWVFRDFPFNFPALIGSMALRCIPEDIRYDYMGALFKLQSQWVLRENAKSTQELFTKSCKVAE